MKSGLMKSRQPALLGAALCVVPLLFAAGCRKDKDAEDKKKAEAAEAKSASSADLESRSASKEKEKAQTNFDVATEEDFEAKIEQEITHESDFNKELDLLEQQIAK
jgi:hypothetical protein